MCKGEGAKDPSPTGWQSNWWIRRYFLAHLRSLVVRSAHFSPHRGSVLCVLPLNLWSTILLLVFLSGVTFFSTASCACCLLRTPHLQELQHGYYSRHRTDSGSGLSREARGPISCYVPVVVSCALCVQLVDSHTTLRLRAVGEVLGPPVPGSSPAQRSFQPGRALSRRCGKAVLFLSICSLPRFWVSFLAGSRGVSRRHNFLCLASFRLPRCSRCAGFQAHNYDVYSHRRVR